MMRNTPELLRVHYARCENNTAIRQKTMQYGYFGDHKRITIILNGCMTKHVCNTYCKTRHIF